MPLYFYLHGDDLHEYQLGRELLGSVAERLPLLRAVDAVQPDTLAFAVVQHGDRIAVADAHDAASEVGGEGLTRNQRKAKKQR